nr:hypothetical protein [Tanacetum cinerariifolium]
MWLSRLMKALDMCWQNKTVIEFGQHYSRNYGNHGDFGNFTTETDWLPCTLVEENNSEKLFVTNMTDLKDAALVQTRLRKMT